MRRPTGRSGHKAGADRTPPGGRAAERLNQDRKARGLPTARTPKAATLVVEVPAAAKASRRPPAATKKKSR
jgi:hypothetical protein